MAQTGWSEPPWQGWIETTGDALLILEAARRGLIPRVTRRLVESERKMITSGSVFVFDEDESGIKRWTDGFYWSPSRILGNFLLYRETDKRGPGHRRSDHPDMDEGNLSNVLSRPKAEGEPLTPEQYRERTLVGSLTNSYKFKQDGMMKKTFSLTIGGVAQHLISYYKVEDVRQGRLRSPSSLPELASLDISPEYLDKTNFRNPPKVEIGVDGLPRYRGEGDDIDTPTSLLSGTLSTQLLGGGPTNILEKRGKRYDPYASAAVTAATGKRRKSNKVSSPTSPGPSPASYLDIDPLLGALPPSSAGANSSSSSSSSSIPMDSSPICEPQSGVGMHGFGEPPMYHYPYPYTPAPIPGSNMLAAPPPMGAYLLPPGAVPLSPQGTVLSVDGTAGGIGPIASPPPPPYAPYGPDGTTAYYYHSSPPPPATTTGPANGGSYPIYAWPFSPLLSAPPGVPGTAAPSSAALEAGPPPPTMASVENDDRNGSGGGSGEMRNVHHLIAVAEPGGEVDQEGNSA